MTDFAELLASYAASLDQLPGGPGPDAEARTLAALTRRTAVARGMDGGLAPDLVAELALLDGRLQAAAAGVEAAVGRQTLARWRASVAAPADAWWWWLDRLAATEAQPSPLWAILAGALLAISLSFTTEISRRFLSGEADLLGVFSTITQALLTLLAGSTLTRAGREWVERGLVSLGAARRTVHRWKAGLAAALLLLMVALYLSLPAIADLYNNRAARQQAAGALTSAIAGYRRAISLSPDHAAAHYNLATAYEEVMDYDQALAEYQTALRADPRLYHAYNNLARLYLLHRQDSRSALALLDGAFAQQPAEPAVRYSLHKNRGWAYLGLELHRLAGDELRQALALRPDGAAAHCLLAQVLEADGQEGEARAEWEQCLAYDAAGESVEVQWRATARERLGP